MKRVAVIVPEFLPVPAVKGGGVENLIEGFLNENEKEFKFEFDVYSVSDTNAKDVCNKYKHTNFHFINFKLNNKFNFLKRAVRRITGMTFLFNKTYFVNIAKIIQHQSYDYILIENKASLVPFLKKRTATPLILHIHNVDQINPNPLVNLDDCYRIIAVSNYVKKEIVHKFPRINPDKVKIVHNYVDANIFCSEDYQSFRNNFRIKNSIGDTDKIILFSGRIIPSKGVKELVQAVQKINSRKTYLLFVGASWYDSKNKTKFEIELEEMSKKLNNPIIFTGYIPHQDIAKYYAVADLCAFPSIEPETAGLVQLESMASSKVTIVSNAGGMPEYIGNDGFIIKLGDSFQSDLTKTISDLIKSSDSELSAKGSRLRQHVLKYSQNNSFQEFIRAIQ